METFSHAELTQWVHAALEEDIGTGDVTTQATVPDSLLGAAVMRARQPLVACGLPLATAAFHALSSALQTRCLVEDGEAVEAGTVLLRVNGPVGPMLSAERVALNFAQRLSGIATLTARFVAAVAGTGAKILDTRKTTPGWRRLEKYAVACGGGTNHRFGLHDLVLIKDNHLAALQGAQPHPIAAAVSRARAFAPQLKVEVEADTLEQAVQAAEAGADIILLDNMSTDQLREAVRRIGGRARTEASGGVTLQTVRAMADTGVDFISVGALTHSAPAADLGLDFETA